MFKATLVATVVLALGLPALGATLLTPSTTTFGTPFTVFCSATNPSDSRTLDVEVELLDANGASVTMTSLVVPPLATQALADPRGTGLRTSLCRFRFRGGRRRLIGNLGVLESDLSSGRVVQVLDAR